MGISFKRYTYGISKSFLLLSELHDHSHGAGWLPTPVTSKPVGHTRLLAIDYYVRQAHVGYAAF